MRIFALTSVAMIAFAANSVLTRYALAFDQIGPGAFVGIRLASGGLMLAALVAWRGSGFRGQGNVISALMLLLYAAAFSYAYVSLDAGIGALILFGGVQVTMFSGAIMAGERPRPLRWAGMIAGMFGLAILFTPGAATPDPSGAILMGFSALGWGIYSLRGKSVKQPLEETAMNFLIAAPIGLMIWFLFPTGAQIAWQGIVLAAASGALASGLGYAIWYSVLPRLQSSLAAIVQLTVPVIALAGGIVFLQESATFTFAVSSALILGGVMLAVLSKR